MDGQIGTGSDKRGGKDTGAGGRARPRVALFDLDHTLLPFDSGMEWLHFLVARGELAAAFEQRYLGYCQDYVAGRRGAEALHALAAQAFAGRGTDEVAQLQQAFGAAIGARVPEAARLLVARHHARGERCCIVTATNEVVARVFADQLGGVDLLASVLDLRGGRFSGHVELPLCHGAEKVRRVGAWLAALGCSWEGLAHSVFYSDSYSDLPLLQKAHEAVAIRPDERLRAHAAAAGWACFDSLEEAL